MKIQVIYGLKGSWYQRMVGEVFEVISYDKEFNLYYVRVSSDISIYKTRFIFKGNTRIVNDTYELEQYFLKYVLK